MKKIFIILILTVFLGNFSFSQINNPVKWETKVSKLSNNKYILITKAIIEDGWHLYSQNIAEGGPVVTTFNYDTQNNSVKLINKTTEPKGHTVHDKTFDMEITYFSGSAIFKQEIEVSDKNIKEIKATVEYMACNDENCTPPTEADLTYDLSKAKIVANSKKATTESDAKEENVAESAEKNENVTKENKETKELVEIKEIVKSKSNKESKKGLWTIFFLSFLAGFAALLTPCVFPMIPMTVSFFTKQSKTKALGIRNAIIYGISIIVIYVLLGTVVTAIFGASSLNALSTNVWFNIIFFLLLVIFAVSFMGAFEITLPSSWGTKADAKADKGGLIGIFFMALALVIVSFSCTGPILGALLVEAASKGGIAPIIGMFGFSLAIAVPFALFAAFPGWMNSLPKSGGWLNTVKVFLGFLELALAFKFLSNADLVLQLHWLEREVFIAIWIAVFGTLALYLFGKIQLPHDSPIKHISVGRAGLGMFVLAFTIYLIPGLWGAPLKIISGFPPPMSYSESPFGVGNAQPVVSGSSSNETSLFPKGSEAGEYGIPTFHDYEKGMEYAKKVNKPALLDFTGHACINCRKMEQFVWSDPVVQNILRNKVVLISLYVDDKRPLKDNEIVDSKLHPGKKLKYIGQKWSEMQTIKYKANSQPLYVFLDKEGNTIKEPQGYESNVPLFTKWLQNGISEYNKKY